MFDFFRNYMWQLFQNYCNCATKTTTMLQLVYNVHPCDHATSSHFHHSLWNAFATNCFIMIPIDIINKATNVPLLKYYYSTML